MDCHTPGLTVYPLYFKLPIANQIIRQDMESAQADFQMTRNQLSGKEPFSTLQMAKMEKVLDEGSMPPARYTFMHWDAIIPRSIKKQLLSWLKLHNPSSGIAAIPVDNPFAPDKQMVELGKRLFADKQLSADGTIACASCHSLNKGGTDRSKVSRGIHAQSGPINAPTVFNAAFNFVQFWDGRAADLQEQAAGPVNNPKEMGSNWSLVISRLKKEPSYVRAFQSAFNGAITDATICSAIASYEKTLLTPNSRFDKFLDGDKTKLSADEQSGYQLFTSKGCASCHTGFNLGGLSFEKMGQEQDYFAWRGSSSEADNGRFNVTHKESDRHKFKVPTLRNIALTYPYFHDGSTSDLKTAVRTMSRFQLGWKATDKECQQIAEFLKSQTGCLNGQQLK